MAKTLGDACTAVIFVEDKAGAKMTVDELRDQLKQPENLWFAYPKGNVTDINRDSLWPIVLAQGIRPNGSASIDDKLTAMRFRPLKDGEEFKGVTG